jgi:hypothetical protein
VVSVTDPYDRILGFLDRFTLFNSRLLRSAHKQERQVAQTLPVSVAFRTGSIAVVGNRVLKPVQADTPLMFVYVRSADIRTRHMTVHGLPRVVRVISDGLMGDLEVSTVMAFCLFMILSKGKRKQMYFPRKGINSTHNTDKRIPPPPSS